MSRPEVWLRGALEGYHAALMPAAHALLQAQEDVEHAAAGLSEGELWARPGGAASAGFHLRHLAGSLDRLLTYARGEELSPAQLAYLRAEGEPGDPPATADALVEHVRETIHLALEQLRATPEDGLFAARKVGRAGLPSTVIGLLFHAGEHSTRHTGQLLTTAKIVRGLRLGRGESWGEDRAY